MSDTFVDIKNMSFRRDERVIYDDISLSIPKGKVTAIMGPSGIGKTFNWWAIKASIRQYFI